MKHWADLLIIVCVVGVAALGGAVMAFGRASGGTYEATYAEFLASDSADAVSDATTQIAYSDFVARVAHDDVADVLLEGPVIDGHLKNGQAIETYAPDDPALMGRLEAHHVTVSVAAEDDLTSLRGILVADFGIALVLGATIYLIQTQSGQRLHEDFSRSHARPIVGPRSRLTFADVAGADDARDELAEVVGFLRHPDQFLLLGARIPKGCLLVGPPGTGKTLLARAIAGEANVPFFTVAGSDFVEMYVGVGASRVRNMFAEAKGCAPSIIFIDEIDAVGRRRSASGHGEYEQTLNQLLVEMDGVGGREGVIVLAATNRPDVLDPALLRPGRFDRQVLMPNPNLGGRVRILTLHLRKVPIGPGIDVERIARDTPGFSGADLANLVNEAALHAARSGHQKVTMNDLETARQKILLGPERRSLVMTEEDRTRIAYHESGHALVAAHVSGGDAVRLVSILPRGNRLGATLALPENDGHGSSKQEIEARIATLCGGVAAEEILLGPDGTTSAAADDIREATDLARRMVIEFGFSATLGPLCFAGSDGEAIPQHAFTRRQCISKATAAGIDREIRRILRQGESTTRALLSRNRDKVDRLARALLERETLSGDELSGLLGAACHLGHDEAASLSKGPNCQLR